ncbi:uncharacterized protein ARMOST_06267 [Armillaria ostoyae]|uniref:Uncharacterized protein n=1 Tax=Armillaria ostoyae TaxID=47428 RepID=A0A284R2K1_ARMOS|nr:uncharacterized protein ARMOST_06267 [Armillaria ostoyae]
MAVSFAISMLIVTAMLVPERQKLNARARRRDLADDAHEGLLGANTSVYGDEKKTLLEGVVETALVEEAQVDDIPVVDTPSISGRASEEGSDLEMFDLLESEMENDNCTIGGTSLFSQLFDFPLGPADILL